MRAADFEAWFRLLAGAPGRPATRRLLAHFGSPSAVLQASREAIAAVVGPSKAAGAGTPSVGMDRAATERQLQQALAWLDAAPDRHALVLGDESYPGPLLESPDPPLMLYAEGDLASLQAPALALVGSRQATPQGRDNARAFARELARQGYAIVSGLAEGIDAAAHEGALDLVQGRTVAVVGTGLDTVYPPHHAGLAARIRAQGCLLSEYMPGTPARTHHFPQRNRIIAGLCQGTLVVEAALRSGSLITARLANEAGREVFAIPGSIHSPQAKGCHALIKQGAKLVESAADVLDELLGAAAPATAPTHRAAPGGLAPSGAADGHADPSPGLTDAAEAIASTAAAPLLAALGHGPCTLDELQSRCGWSTDALMAALLELELEGQVDRLPGGRFERRHRA